MKIKSILIVVSANIYFLCKKRYLEKFSFVHFPEEKRKYWNLIDVNQTFCVVSFDINLIFEMTESWNIKVQNLKLSLQNFTVLKLQELNVKVNRLQSNLSVAPFANTEISNWFLQNVNILIRWVMRYESISNLCYKLKQSIKLVSRKSKDFSTFLKVDSFSLQKDYGYKLWIW